jgi:hypothetical protein
MSMRSVQKNRLGRAAGLTALALLFSPLSPGTAAAQGRPPAGAAPKQPRLTKLPKLLKFVEAPYPE